MTPSGLLKVSRKYQFHTPLAPLRHGGFLYSPLNNHHLTINNLSGTHMRNEIVRSGITFGSALAIAISWSQNTSILWAIVHGFLSWLYVIYFALFL